MGRGGDALQLHSSGGCTLDVLKASALYTLNVNTLNG